MVMNNKIRFVPLTRYLDFGPKIENNNNFSLIFNKKANNKYLFIGIVGLS